MENTEIKIDGVPRAMPSNAISAEIEEEGDSEDDCDDTQGKSQRVGKQHGNAPRNNHKQNEQTDSIARDLGLTPEQARELHDYISGQGYSYQEILDVAQELFNK